MKKKEFLCHIMPSLFVAIIFFASSTAYAAGQNSGEVYKWTDESGNIHYSDKKPNDAESKKIKVSGGKSTKPRSSAQAQAQALDVKKAREQQEQTAKQKQETEQSQMEQLCQAIRDNLKKFEENSRVKTNENGTLRYMTPEEIASKKAEYQVTLKERC